MSVAVDAGYAVGTTITADRANYWRYYGLRRNPFVLGVRDESEFYLAPRWEQCFDLIHYLCREANVLLTVVGEKGGGKSTFLSYFLDHFCEDMQTCRLSGSPHLTAAPLMTELTKAFALSAPEAGTLEEQLDAQLTQMQYASKPCLLTIDNAHRLPDETLQALLYFVAQQSENQMRLHVLLLGEASLQERLKEKEICHHLTLEPFDQQETKNYLAVRLTAAGLPAAVPFSQASLTRIYNLTGGVPSRINAVARQALIDAMEQRQLHSVFDFLRSRKTFLLGGGVLLGAVLLFASFFARNSHIPAFITAARASDKVVSNPVVPAVADAGLPVLPTPIKPIVVASNQALVINESSVTVEDQAQPQPKPEEKKVEEKKIENKKVEEKQVEEKQVEKKKVEEKKVEGKKVSVNPQTNPQGHYTVQLIGVSSEQSLKAFIATHHLDGKTTHTHSHHQNKDWYTVLYGRYSTQSAAEQAIQQLPQTLRELHPWVRKV